MKKAQRCIECKRIVGFVDMDISYPPITCIGCQYSRYTLDERLSVGKGTGEKQ